MILEIRIPSPGESVTEVAIGSWLVQDGDRVEKDQEIAEVESDKATLPLIATETGQIRIQVKAGEKAGVGEVACTIDTGLSADVPKTRSDQTRDAAFGDAEKIRPEKEPAESSSIAEEDKAKTQPDQPPLIKLTPLARRKLEEKDFPVDDILKELRASPSAEGKPVGISYSGGNSQPVIHVKTGKEDRSANRVPMSPLRRKLARRLVGVKNETAMLTTFNELDMSMIMEIRQYYKEAFHEKHGTKLGLMSFFSRAASMALLQFPRLNSAIEGDEIVIPSYIDLGIAVQAEKGLMVPVIRNAERMTVAGLEKEIAALAEKARNKRISLEEMTGGTFTITNGGVFGSMLSTPILNPPQSAILGMHNIVERPVAIKGNVVIRPIMYLALTYDHRIIDGADAVRFLLRVKELIESPLQMSRGGETEKDLLDL
jgi:2-oxoglutarate dehydrogenase E2 component (dihydrolipoamide succinyltransferase)